MFLNALNEKEGKNFLELATLAMSIDGTVKESEKTVFETYRKEMVLQNYTIQNKPYDKLAMEFRSSTKKIKKIVIIELAGVLYADEEIDSSEQSWLMKLGHDLEFRDSEIRKMLRWSMDFNALLNEAISYINK